MPVSLDYLIGDGGRREIESLAYIPLNKGVNVGVGAYGSGQLSHGYIGHGVLDALPVPFHLLIPKGEDKPESHGFSVYPVGATDARSVLVPESQLAKDAGHLVYAREDRLESLPEER